MRSPGSINTYTKKMFEDYKSWMFNAGSGPTEEEYEAYSEGVVVDVVVT
jgi:hypothetical protein